MLQRQEEAQISAPTLNSVASVTPAAGQRVTPEELNAALESLESSKQEQARQVQNTVAIGEVVNELGLNVTPEEVWQQVQKQRAQVAPPPPTPAAESKIADTVNDTLHAAAQHVRTAVGQATAAAQAAAAQAAAEAVRAEQAQRESVRAPRERRRFRGGGLVLALLAAGWVFFSSNHGVMVNGDHATRTYSGSRGVAVINGDNDAITLAGSCDTLVVDGDHDQVTVTGTVKHVITNGDHNVVIWSNGTNNQVPTIMDNGTDNRIDQLYAPHP